MTYRGSYRYAARAATAALVAAAAVKRTTVLSRGVGMAGDAPLEI